MLPLYSNSIERPTILLERAPGIKPPPPSPHAESGGTLMGGIFSRKDVKFSGSCFGLRGNALPTADALLLPQLQCETLDTADARPWREVVREYVNSTVGAGSSLRHIPIPHAGLLSVDSYTQQVYSVARCANIMELLPQACFSRDSGSNSNSNINIRESQSRRTVPLNRPAAAAAVERAEKLADYALSSGSLSLADIALRSYSSKSAHPELEDSVSVTDDSLSLPSCSAARRPWPGQRILLLPARSERGWSFVSSVQQFPAHGLRILPHAIPAVGCGRDIAAVVDECPESDRFVDRLVHNLDLLDEPEEPETDPETDPEESTQQSILPFWLLRDMHRKGSRHGDALSILAPQLLPEPPQFVSECNKITHIMRLRRPLDAGSTAVRHELAPDRALFGGFIPLGPLAGSPQAKQPSEAFSFVSRFHKLFQRSASGVSHMHRCLRLLETLPPMYLAKPEPALSLLESFRATAGELCNAASDLAPQSLAHSRSPLLQHARRTTSSSSSSRSHTMHMQLQLRDDLESPRAPRLTETARAIYTDCEEDTLAAHPRAPINIVTTAAAAAAAVDVRSDVYAGHAVPAAGCPNSLRRASTPPREITPTEEEEEEQEAAVGRDPARGHPEMRVHVPCDEDLNTAVGNPAGDLDIGMSVFAAGRTDDTCQNSLEIEGQPSLLQIFRDLQSRQHEPRQPQSQSAAAPRQQQQLQQLPRQPAQIPGEDCYRTKIPEMEEEMLSTRSINDGEAQTEMEMETETEAGGNLPPPPSELLTTFASAANPLSWSPPLLNLRVFVSESQLEATPWLVRELSERGVICVDAPLDDQLAFILDGHTGVALVSHAVGSNRVALKCVIKALAAVAFKFRVIWVFVVHMQTHESPPEDRSRVGDSGSNLSGHYPGLCQSLSQFPCRIVLRHCFNATLTGQLVLACQDAQSEALRGFRVTADEYKQRSIFRALERGEAASDGNGNGDGNGDEAEDQFMAAAAVAAPPHAFANSRAVTTQPANQRHVPMRPVLSAHCQFLQLLPTVNFYLAAELLSRWSLRQLVCQLSPEQLINQAHTCVRLPNSAALQDMTALLGRHVGLRRAANTASEATRSAPLGLTSQRTSSDQGRGVAASDGSGDRESRIRGEARNSAMLPAPPPPPPPAPHMHLVSPTAAAWARPGVRQSSTPIRKPAHGNTAVHMQSEQQKQQQQQLGYQGQGQSTLMYLEQRK